MVLLDIFLLLCLFSFASCTSLLDGYPVLFSGFVYTPASLSYVRAWKAKSARAVCDGVPFGRSGHI